MTTTDHRNAETSPTRVEGGVIRIDALQRRRRLDGLLSTRRHLATMAAQQRSHGLDDAQESFNLQFVVESTIRDEFPEEYEEYFPNWLTDEIASEHPSGVLTAECGICRSIAAASQINLTPPEAA